MAGPEITFQFPRYTPEQLAQFARQRGEEVVYEFRYRSPTLPGDNITTVLTYHPNAMISTLRQMGVSRFSVVTGRTE